MHVSLLLHILHYYFSLKVCGRDMEKEGVSDSVPLPPPLMSSTTGPEKTDRKGDRSADIMERYGYICMHT